MRTLALSQRKPPSENRNIFATHTVRAYVWIVSNWSLQQSLDKSTESRDRVVLYVGETPTSSLLLLALACNLLYSTSHTYGHTLMQSSVWDNSYVDMHLACGEKTLVLTWLFLAVCNASFRRSPHMNFSAHLHATFALLLGSPRAPKSPTGQRLRSRVWQVPSMMIKHKRQKKKHKCQKFNYPLEFATLSTLIDFARNSPKVARNIWWPQYRPETIRSTIWWPQVDSNRT